MTYNANEIFNITIRTETYNPHITYFANQNRRVKVITCKGKEALMNKLAELKEMTNITIVRVWNGCGNIVTV